MTRHEARGFVGHHPGLGAQHAEHRQAMSHQGRLRVLSQHEVFRRPLEHQARKVLRQGVIDLLEDHPRLREGFRQIAAHADRLTSLPGKDECRFHDVGYVPISCEGVA